MLVERLSNDYALGIAEERSAPEFKTVAAFGGSFVADAIDGSDINSIGDGVAALDGAPGIALSLAVGGLFGRVPADGGGVEKNYGAVQGGEAGALWIPLIPADQSCDAAGFGIERTKTEVAGSEIKFFVVGGIVGDVHFAVDAGDFAVSVDDGGGVVIDAGGATFEKRGDDDDFGFLGDAAERFGGGAGNGFGQFEILDVFALAEVLGLKKFGQTDDLGAIFGGFFDTGRGLGEVFLRVAADGHLDQADVEFGFVGHK